MKVRWQPFVWHFLALFLNQLYRHCQVQCSKHQSSYIKCAHLHSLTRLQLLQVIIIILDSPIIFFRLFFFFSKVFYKMHFSFLESMITSSNCVWSPVVSVYKEVQRQAKSCDCLALCLDELPLLNMKITVYFIFRHFVHSHLSLISSSDCHFSKIDPCRNSKHQVPPTLTPAKLQAAWKLNTKGQNTAWPSLKSGTLTTPWEPKSLLKIRLEKYSNIL